MGIVFGSISVWFVLARYEKLFFIYNLIIGLIFGFIGTLLFLIASFTDHIVTYFNENLFFANPFTLLIFVLSILVIKNKEKYLKLFYHNWLVITIIALVGIVVKIFPAFDQDNLQAMTLIFPLIAGSYISTYILKNRD